MRLTLPDIRHRPGANGTDRKRLIRWAIESARLDARPRLDSLTMLSAATRSTQSKSPGLASAVLTAAHKILLREGVDALTARKIAAEARCTAPAIYFHYRSLDELKFRLRMDGHAILARYLRQSQRRGDSFE